jgi:hypothetical protein
MAEQSTSEARCPKCGQEVSELVDVESSDDFSYDEVCAQCICKHGRNVAREKNQTSKNDDNYHSR